MLLMFLFDENKNLFKKQDIKDVERGKRWKRRKIATQNTKNKILEIFLFPQ